MEDTTVSFKVSFKRNTIPVCVAASTTVGELQVALERKLQIATGNQKFLSKGKMLEPQLTLAEANITNGSKLMLMGKQDLKTGTGLRRAHSGEAYERLVAYPDLSAEAKQRITAQRGQGGQAAFAPVTEMDVFLERTASRRQVAAARNELNLLKQACLSDADGAPGSPLRRTASEMARCGTTMPGYRNAQLTSMPGYRDAWLPQCSTNYYAWLPQCLATEKQIKA